MTAAVAFRLLGPFSVHLNGVPLRKTITGPAQSLLINCILHSDQRHRRDALMAQVWDGLDAPSRAAFSTALWRVRRFIEPLPGVILEQEGDTLRLSLDDNIVCDAMELLEQTTLRVPLDDEGRKALCKAVDCWRGPFGEGLDQHWLLAARERFHGAYLTALSTLMRDAGDSEEYELALDFGRRILDQDPFREGIHCEMLWLWVLTGQRVKAIKAHRQFCILLRDELDIGPMAETTALFDYICNGLEATPTRATTSHETRPAHLYQGYLAALAQQRSQIYASLRRQGARD